ncbi:MAG: RNA polymerase sigma factor [Pseudomarimonas sp.]
MNVSAIEALIKRFASRVRAQIAAHRLDRYGIDPADVEQDVHIRLWKVLERDPNALLPASYIQKVVASVLVDAVRRGSLRATEALPEDDDGNTWEPATQDPRPDQVAAESRQLDRVAQAIALIPERRRRPLQLYLQGFTIPEVAELSALTFDAARKLVYRGLAETKQRLRDAGEDGFDD